MQHAVGFLFAIFISCSLVSAKPNETKGSRVHDGKLSESEHFSAKTGEHNQEYDHDAFLGSEKKEFDKLNPTESKRRLGLIVDRIDKNKDGKVSKEELTDWIRFASKRWLYDDRDRLWNHLKKRETYALKWLGKKTNPDAEADPDSPIPWKVWKLDVFGEEVTEDEEEKFQRDIKIWHAADRNSDNVISKDEFPAVIHPHQFEYMKHLVLEDTMKDLDRDKDGYVSQDEYIADLLKSNKIKDANVKENFIKEQLKIFHSDHDKDKDGRLNKEEINDYVFPNFDHSTAEVDHLISHADKNKDGMLSKEEILADFNVFVGSSATEYGKGLKRHDEF